MTDPVESPDYKEACAACEFNERPEADSMILTCHEIWRERLMTGTVDTTSMPLSVKLCAAEYIELKVNELLGQIAPAQGAFAENEDDAPPPPPR